MPQMYLLKEKSPDNDPALIPILEGWLNFINSSNPKLLIADDGVFDQQTRLRAVTFQTMNKIVPANGVVGITTWNALAKRISLTPLQIPKGVPDWLQKLINQRNKVSGGKIIVNRKLFSEIYTEAFGTNALKHAVGLSSILDFIAADESIDDIRWAAYMLATTKHETGHNFMPVEEIGRGAGHDYGNDVTVKCGGKNYTHKYYGRGYVQLTKGDNYVNMSQELYKNCQMAEKPEMVMVPQTAYEIMSYGMRYGRFRGNLVSSKEISPKTHKPHTVKHRDPYNFEDFFNDKLTDYFNARQIINGDRNVITKGNTRSNGQLIEDYALKFEAMVRVCLLNK